MKNNTKTIGVILLAAAMGLMAWQSYDQAQRLKAWRAAHPEAAKVETAKAATPAVGAATAVTPVVASAPKAVEALAAETLYVLENDFAKITFTSRGGAVRSVVLKQYKATAKGTEGYAMVAPEKLPFWAMATAPELEAVDLATYGRTSQTADSITFERTVSPGLVLERHYTLTAPTKERTAQGYLINHTLVWRNTTAQTLQLPAYQLNVGVAQPIESDPSHTFLNFGYHDGKNGHYITPAQFKAGGFLFWSKPANPVHNVSATVNWTTLNNQFFALVTTPKVPSQAATAVQIIGEGVKPQESIAGFIKLEAPVVAAGSSTTVEIGCYAGPKEYARLSSLGNKQDDTLQWGWPIFAFFSKLFISMLNGIAHAVKNYGVAIILLTLIIRGLMWPFTAAASKASKKMAAVQPILKGLQEKYKSNPEKLNKETVKLFQENQINPLAGCLPALLQIPVFIGFFYMLRSAAELRFESFLWIKDLSMPDTIATLGGFPINPLPIVMFVSMYFQIKVTPSSGDAEQQKIMQFTPFLFAFMLYNFSAGLTLYWTLSNVVSIVQQLLVNRQKEVIATGDNAVEVKTTPVK